MTLLEVVYKPQVSRLPAQQRAGQRARGGHFGSQEACQPKCPLAASGETETTGRSRWRPITSAMVRHALIRDCVQHPTCWGLLERPSEQVRGVESVNGRPAFRPTCDVSRNALTPSNPNQGRDEIGVALSVNRRREPQDRRAHLLESQQEGCAEALRR